MTDEELRRKAAVGIRLALKGDSDSDRKALRSYVEEMDEDDQTVIDAVTHQRSQAGQLQLLLDAGFMRADGLHREMQRVADVGQTFAFHESAQHLQLPV